MNMKNKLMDKRFIGSTAALILGVLCLAAGITDPSNNLLVAAPALILGALAYRSAKKRSLKIVSSSNIRIALEWTAILIIILLVVMLKDLLELIATDPFPIVIIPVWAVTAYIIAFLKGRK